MVIGRSARVALSAFIAVALVGMFAPAVFAAGHGAAPYGLTVRTPSSSSGGSLKLTWKVDEASRVAAYKIFRSSDPDSGFKLVHTEQVQVTEVKMMDYFDTGLKDGARYYYRVALTGEDGRELGRTPTAEGSLPALSRAKTGGYPGKHIIISVYDQRIYFLENDVLVKSHLCSTGTDDHPTPFGVFTVQFHEYLVISEMYGGAYCYWWMNFAPDTGMHALPYNPSSGTYTGASLLGHKASHGCVRQTVADAQWAYNWTPNGTRVDVSPYHWEPPPPPPPPFKGGHASQGLQAATEWYLAEGYTGGNFDEYVLMANPNGMAANVTADFMKPDGSVVSGSYSIPALSRSTIHVDSVGGLDNIEVSTRLRSDQPITSERSMYFHDFFNSKEGGTCSAGVSSPQTTWYLAEGYTGGEFDEFILVQNPGDTDGTVGMDFMRSDGQSFHRDWPIKAHSRLSVHVDDIAEVSQAEVSTRVTCDQPVVAERAQYFNYYGKREGNASAAVRAPAKKWYLAEGYTGGEFDEYVLIQNPGGTRGRAVVTFMCGDGLNVVKTYDLLPRSRFTIHVDDIPELASKELSTMVEADVDVITERSMYFVSYGRPGGADAPGVSAADRFWYLAEGYTGGDFDTYVLVMNPNDQATKVDVSFLKPNGEQKGLSFTVAAHSRYTVHADAVEGLSDAEFASAVTGDLPIICERAMYFAIPR